MLSTLAAITHIETGKYEKFELEKMKMIQSAFIEADKIFGTTPDEPEEQRRLFSLVWFQSRVYKKVTFFVVISHALTIIL